MSGWESGSYWSDAVISAVFVFSSAVSVLATSVSVAVPLLPTLPTFQTPLVRSYAPLVEVAETKVMPAGIASFTTTPEASLGPALVTVTVKVTCWLATGRTGLAFLASDRSAICGVSVLPAWSSSVGTLLFGVESGSRWSDAMTSAVFVVAVVPATLAVICSVALVPFSTAGTVHTPVAVS